MTETVPVYHWIASTQLYYQDKRNIEKVTSDIALNVVFNTKENRINAIDLMRTQQGANLQFNSRLPEEMKEHIEVIDVVFNSISCLGLWLPGEFLGTTETDLETKVNEGIALGKALTI